MGGAFLYSGGDYIAKEIKEKQPIKAVVKEKAAAAPKELAKRGAIRAAAQSKRQIKDVTEHGGDQTQNSGNEAISSAEQGAQSVLHAGHHGHTVIHRPKSESGTAKEPKVQATESRYDEYFEQMIRQDSKQEVQETRTSHPSDRQTEPKQPAPNERHRADVIKEKTAQNQAREVAENLEVEKIPVKGYEPIPSQTPDAIHYSNQKNETLAGKQARKEAQQKRRQSEKAQGNEKHPPASPLSQHSASQADTSKPQFSARLSRRQTIRSSSATIPEAPHARNHTPSESPAAIREQFRSPRASIIREKPVNRSIKTASRSVRSTSESIKTPAQVSQAAAQNARKASQAAQTVKKAGKKTERTIRWTPSKWTRSGKPC